MSTQVVDAFHALTPEGGLVVVVPELGLALVAVYLLFAEALRVRPPRPHEAWCVAVFRVVSGDRASAGLHHACECFVVVF
jgi:hypothetical protein